MRHWLQCWCIGAAILPPAVLLGADPNPASAASSAAAPTTATAPAVKARRDAAVSPSIATVDAHGSIVPKRSDDQPADAGAERKARLLRAVDNRIARFDGLISRIPDIQQHAVQRALSDGFKDRRVALRANYSDDTANDLLWDMNVEYQRLVYWLAAPTLTVDAASAMHNADISLDLLLPDPADEAAVRSALDVIDRVIQEREARCQNMSPGPEYDAKMVRLAEIRRLRAAVDAHSTREAWTALIAAMRTTAGSK